MRKLFWVLVLVATPASAEWVRAAESDEAILYVDPASIRKDGEMRTVRTVHDLRDKGPSGEMSRQAVEVHDCKESRYRTLSYSLYPEPMSGGQMLLTYDYVSRWAAVVPDTPPANALRFVCNQ